MLAVWIECSIKSTQETVVKTSRLQPTFFVAGFVGAAAGLGDVEGGDGVCGGGWDIGYALRELRMGWRRVMNYNLRYD